MNLDELLLQKQLPTVPAVAMRILKLVDDVNFTSADLAKEIKHDPAISTQLLCLANSARYSPNRQVTSIELAVSMLGRATVVSTALTFSLSQYVEADGELRDEFERYWRSTVLQAISAELLAGNDSAKGGEYFMIGLMADIGRLAMICILRSRYTDVMAAARKAGQRLEEAEERRFGFTHTTVGCRLAKLWGLPDSLIDAIRLQHAGVADVINKPNASAIDAVAPIASHISEMFENSALPNAAIAVDCLATQFGSINAEQLLQATRQRVNELEHVLKIDADSLPPVVDIMAHANRQLANLLIQRSEEQQPEVLPIVALIEGSPGPAIFKDSVAISKGNTTVAVNHYAVLSQDEFEKCASPYIESCLASGGSVGMLLIQCNTQGICQDRNEDDRLVRQVCHLVNSSLRPEDLVARFFGQFLYVLCRIDYAEELQFIAERLQSQLVLSLGADNIIPTHIGGVAVDGSIAMALDQLQQLAFFRLDKARQNQTTGTDVTVYKPAGTTPPDRMQLAVN